MIKRLIPLLILLITIAIPFPALAVLSITITGHSGSKIPGCLGSGCYSGFGSGGTVSGTGGTKIAQPGDSIPELDIGDGSVTERITTKPGVNLSSPAALPNTSAQYKANLDPSATLQTTAQIAAQEYLKKPSTAVDLCSSRGVSLISQVTGASCVQTTYCTVTGNCLYASGGAAYVNVGVNVLRPETSPACPNGWTVSGTSCVNTNPKAAVPDGFSDYEMEGGELVHKAGIDADESIYLDNDSIGKLSAGAYMRSGYDSNARPVAVEVKAKSGGGTVIVHSSQSADNEITQTTYNLDSDGVVVDTRTATAMGNLVPDPHGGAPTVQAPTDVAGLGTGGAGGTSAGLSLLRSASGGSSSPSFPSDYAKSGDISGMSALLGGKLDVIKQGTDKLAENEEVTDPADPSANGSFEDKFFKNTFTGLLGWRLPAHTSTCPVGEFEFNDHVYQVDSHCQLIQNHYGVLSTVMIVSWIVTALFIVLGA